MTYVMKVRGLCKEYGKGEARVRALGGVDLEVRVGETLTVTGPSGCGKSTLLYLLGCLDRPTAGEVWIEERRVDLMSERCDGESAEVRGRLRIPVLSPPR